MASPTSLISVWAAYLTLRRVQLGLTQEQLAAETGFTGGQISKWENGVNVPDLATLIRWADGLGMDVELVSRG